MLAASRIDIKYLYKLFTSIYCSKVTTIFQGSKVNLRFWIFDLTGARTRFVYLFMLVSEYGPRQFLMKEQIFWKQVKYFGFSKNLIFLQLLDTSALANDRAVNEHTHRLL